MSESRFEISPQDAYILVAITGYLNEELGEKLEKELLARIVSGKQRVVIDMSRCDLINSPGVALLFDLCIRITEDFLGWVCFCHLTPLMADVFAMAGVLPIAKQFPDVVAAAEQARNWTPPD